MKLQGIILQTIPYKLSVRTLIHVLNEMSIVLCVLVNGIIPISAFDKWLALQDLNIYLFIISNFFFFCNVLYFFKKNLLLKCVFNFCARHCPKGYYGYHCNINCPYPNYGEHCSQICDCLEQNCNNIQGCPAPSKYN